MVPHGSALLENCGTNLLMYHCTPNPGDKILKSRKVCKKKIPYFHQELGPCSLDWGTRQRIEILFKQFWNKADPCGILDKLFHSNPGPKVLLWSQDLRVWATEYYRYKQNTNIILRRLIFKKCKSPKKVDFQLPEAFDFTKTNWLCCFSFKIWFTNEVHGIQYQLRKG